MNQRKVGVAAGFTAIAFALTSCVASPPAPTYHEVHAEAAAALQEVVDALPEGIEVEDRSMDPYACNVASGGLFEGGGEEGEFFTGHLVAYPDAAFDGEAFIEGLPEVLGDDWKVDKNASEMSIPSVTMLTGGVLVTVAAASVEDNEGPYVDILAISNCGTVPTP